MSTKQNRQGIRPEGKEKRESGTPGVGQGPKDEIERSGVYPVSSMDEAGPDAMAHDEASWGQGERGAAVYEDSGGSELIYLGGRRALSAGRHRDLPVRTGARTKKINKPARGG